MNNNLSIKQKTLLFLKGVAMGAADVVPGVSGGTIAFIAGIYDELLGSISSIARPKTLSVLFKQGPVAFWQHCNATFLMVLFTGVGLSIFSLAHVISYLLEQYPILLWAFFFGLIIASIVHVSKQLSRFATPEAIGVAVGALVVLWIASIQPSTPPEGLWFVFVAGAIAICAMILPGISGSFLLLLMGMYEVVITAIKDLHLSVLLTFIAGTGIGLLSFSHVLVWLLKHYHRITFSVLIGFLLGSLYVIWPWKQVLTKVVRHGQEVALTQKAVLPSTFEQFTGQSAQLLPACLLAVVGFILIMGLESFAKEANSSSPDSNDSHS